jgi:hypothetical protein
MGEGVQELQNDTTRISWFFARTGSAVSCLGSARNAAGTKVARTEDTEDFGNLLDHRVREVTRNSVGICKALALYKPITPHSSVTSVSSVRASSLRRCSSRFGVENSRTPLSRVTAGAVPEE